MYLGRDGDYDKKESPVERYINYRLYIGNAAWETKDATVNQIIEKLPLDKYLKNGMKILNIK